MSITSLDKVIAIDKMVFFPYTEFKYINFTFDNDNIRTAFADWTFCHQEVSDTSNKTHSYTKKKLGKTSIQETRQFKFLSEYGTNNLTAL